jgi:hypothetical protein
MSFWPMPFWIVLALQTPAVTPPPGPAWPRAEQIAGDLRRACMSEAGIRIAMQDWAEGQAAARADEPENARVERELGEAAYVEPIDVDRLDRAAQARNANQARRLAEGERRAIATLRRLSPADRAIFARRLTVYRPNQPVRSCPER